MLAESLSLRLPGCPSACADIMRSAVDGEVEGGGGSQSGGEDEEVGGDEEEDSGGEMVLPSIGAGSDSRPAEWGRQAGGVEGGRSERPPPCSTMKRPAAAAGHVLYRPSATVRLPESRLAVASVVCSGAASSQGRLRSLDPSGSRSGSDPAPCLEEADAAAALGRPPRSVTSGSRSRSGLWTTAASSSCDTASGAVRPREAGPNCSHTEEEEIPDGIAHQGSTGGTERYIGLLRRLFEPHWPEAGLREWVYTCSGRRPLEVVGTVGAGSGTHLPQQGSRSGSGSTSRPVEGGAGSRMYLQHGEGELRAALTLVSAD